MKFGIVLRSALVCASMLCLSGCSGDNNIVVTNTLGGLLYKRSLPDDYVFVNAEFTDTNGFSTTTIYFKRKEN